jgi:CubicO group peptidase (beta-lactamase class C family)
MSETGLPRKIAVFLLFVLWVPSICIGRNLPVGLEEDIRRVLTEFRVPGLAVGVVKDGAVVWLQGYGLKNAERREVVDKNTVFGLGSLTKGFTAGLVGSLVSEGKVQWDDKVVQHLPGFELYDPWVTKEMTLRDVLCHRTGLEDAGLVFIGSKFTRDEITGKARLLRPTRDFGPKSGFRSVFTYNNMMYIALGQLVSRVTGKSWDQNVRERIFGPLGMTSSMTGIRDFKPGDDLSQPHAYDVKGQPVPIAWGDMDGAAAAGGINSSAADMLQWVKVHLEDGVVPGKKLWDSEVIREMHRPQMLIGFPLRWEDPFQTSGLGWFVSRHRGQTLVWNAGNCDGMSSAVGLIPEKRLGVVVLVNVFRPGIEANLMLRILDAYQGVPEKDRWSLGEPVNPSGLGLRHYAPAREEASVSQATAEKYLGAYENEMYGRVFVRLRKDRLNLDFEAYPGASLHAIDGQEFTADFGRDVSYMFGLILGAKTYTEAKFELDGRGRIRGLALENMGVFRKK